MAYHSPAPRSPNAYDRWDSPTHKPEVNVSHLLNSQYYAPRSRYYAYDHPMPAPQPRYRSRNRWPPPPTVEDEAVSLSREHSPAVPDLVDGQAQARGALDQLPIIQDAYPGASDPPHDKHKNRADSDSKSLTSRSSTDGVGPLTPPESATSSENPDRRFVWRPEPGVDIPVSYDDPDPAPKVKAPENTKEVPNTRPRKQVPRLGTNDSDGLDKQPSPLKTGRAPSPYSYSSNSGRSTFSGDYLMSPDTLSPEVRASTLPKANNDARPIAFQRDLHPREGRARAASGSAIKMERPTFGRYKSSTAYPGDPSPAIKIPINAARIVDLSSDESDIGPGESAELRNGRRSTRYSHIRPEQPRQSSALRYDEAVQQDGRRPLYVTRPRSPPYQPNPGTWDSMPSPEANFYGSSMPSTAPLAKSAMKKSSQGPSPLVSPSATPPPSPGANSKRFSAEATSIERRSRPNSRPTTPQYNTPSSAKGGLDPLDGSYYRDYRSAKAPSSREPSPRSSLPSSDPVSASSQSDYVKIPTPSSSNTTRSRSSTHTSDIPIRPREASAPFILAPPPRAQTLGVPHARRTHSSVDPREVPHHLPGDPPVAAPTQALLSPPPKSPAKRPISPGQPIILPACPRPRHILGYNDWSTLRSCPRFDICPTCRKAIEDAGWIGKFHPSAPKGPNYETVCDLSDPWVRMAWLLVLQNRATPDDVVHPIIETKATEGNCPGNSGAVRVWHRIYDPETQRQVSGFDVCPHCVRNIETIFPNLTAIFHPAQVSDSHRQRICHLSHDSRRFAQYVDMLEEISKQAEQYRRPPNMLRFVHLARKMAEVHECTRDDMVVGQPWHFMPQFPEFTVCEECYHAVVWPEIVAGSELAGSFQRSLQLLPPTMGPASCQLYSPRMRNVFLDACRRNDFRGLWAASTQRVRVERDLQARLAAITRAGVGGPEMAEEVARLVEEWKRWE